VAMNPDRWGKTLAALRAPGKRNPRVLVRDVTRVLKDALGNLSHTWSVGLQTYDPITEDGRVVTVRWRQKRPDELPENQPERWERLEEYARAIRFTCEELERFARLQAIETAVALAGPDRPTDTHTEHCCRWDGCKYCDDQACTVARRTLIQSYPCPMCPGQED